MFRHVVVPLDGSQLSEAVLPASAFIAEKLGARVTLLHVLERDASPEVHGDHHLTSREEAYAYLTELARVTFPAGAQVEQHVHEIEITDVPRGIVDHIEELAPDLIVMTTHGRGGLGSVLFGSIAQQVISRSTVPVMLIRPPVAGETPSFAPRRLLVPLDGNPEHEQALTVAEGMASVCGCHVRLVLVVPTVGALTGREAATARVLPGASRLMLEMAERDALAYLEKHAARLAGAGVEVSTEVRRGDPITSIVEAARAPTRRT